MCQLDPDALKLSISQLVEHFSHIFPGNSGHNQDMNISPRVWHSGVLESAEMVQIFRSVAGAIGVLNASNLIEENCLGILPALCNVSNREMFWIQPERK